MPLYDYACPRCGKSEERLLKIAEMVQNYPCDCGGTMDKIIVKGFGGVFSDEPSWLQGESGAQIRECIQDSARLAAGLDQPITTRSQHKAYLKEHGIVPLDKGNNIWMI